MKDLFFDFLESPSRDTYLAVRSALVASENYNPYSNELSNVNALLEAGKLEEARSQIAAAMPNLLLSPSAHMILSFIAKQSNDEKGAEMERYIAAACCDGILATGEGTKDQPYLVTRTSDEYDVLQYQGKEFTGQALVHDGDRNFDRMQCADGSQLWFDITDAYGKLADRFGRAE